jgi:hypothetical protein
MWSSSVEKSGLLRIKPARSIEQIALVLILAAFMQTNSNPAVPEHTIVGDISLSMVELVWGARNMVYHGQSWHFQMQRQRTVYPPKNETGCKRLTKTTAALQQ